MNRHQIDILRDLAIEHLPRAQADREGIKRYGGTHADFYRRIAVTSTMARGNAGTTAIEFAAANVLESVAILCGEQENPLTKTEKATLLHRLATDAKELCICTGTAISWLDSVSTTLDSEPEPTPKQLMATIQKTNPSIAGRQLNTKEAAEVLGYKENTLRKWSSDESGPIRPKKLGRQLRWSGDEILALLTKK